MDAILWPLKVAVAWVMVYIHKALVFIGLPDGPGVAWVLSIVGLTIFVRLLIMPLFVKQIRASRGMQLMQPELQALQAKYKGKTDPASRQRQQEEMMALYRKHGTNPFSSCMPILVQMPVFFALFRVLASLQAVATGTYANHDSIGPLTAQLAEDVQASTLFGAHLSESFMNSSDVTTKVVTVIMIIAMSVSQWYTMAQLTMKNMPESSKNSDNPMMRSQRMMMTIMPIFFAFTGVQFQIGVLVYWVTTNLWTMGQQFLTIRNMPAPGSEAEKKYRARVNAKRARKGLPSLEEEEAAKRAAELEAAGKTGGQRVQPVRKNRQKRASANASMTEEERYQAASDEEEAIEEIETNIVGLTPEEIARRRYEKRARQRQQRKKSNGKKRQSR
ncbi:membrane protein insertase YidC [Actinomyces urogenitalis]|jgi:YidC/Oxa1 family membrane protein insertase|uniref:membrane protein insertase YidC n=1 Tax=Actinomyces urogenitalis TaxID=103621 RepID=UPI00050DA33C|nr:membrane protein insertase YidC [Actinomyces urogenitalis]KGF04465.1 preprotein translocase subunit YidC [Actinomyces urogenitalis S6-C4]KGF04474.1 preprotein translocase subunit YidC [Actinomyces urogenitalis S6-C4]MCI7457986.1 membrane protein insertase YidC [Actinomyces urogenitalis]MDU0865027.1 membrane protein insertase YidC [Actinomyces urogenitalis]MDU0875479.1 membrane protein insertase YidC [Actinomyces urogenitalis]